MSIKILFVCLGNICRSPMGEGMMKSITDQNPLIEIDSAGTGAYHIGNLPDPRMIATAAKHGIVLSSRARQFKSSDFQDFDYLIAMDASNRKNMLALSTDPEDKKKIFLMRDFDADFLGHDVPDPYYGGDAGFENVYQIIQRSCQSLYQYILTHEK